MRKNHRKRTGKVAILPADPYESAKIAGLRYVQSDQPGIRRRRSGHGFTYIDARGKAVKDSITLGRIRSLVIPPAWTDVWICPFESGHLQAVGKDARGRKQYRYHPLYRRIRDATKYGRMLAFGRALPKIRARIQRDLKRNGLPRNKVLAAVVRLLETTCIRVGNEEYEKQNDSIGLTTMRDEHVVIQGQKMRFRFKGKSGQEHDVSLDDRRLARVVRDCQCIPGEDLFQYMDDGENGRVRSEDVNDYIREISGAEFTAKDFRTWNGTRQAALALETIGAAETQDASKKMIVDAVKETAARLGNRPATCRKYYIHPAILDGYVDRTLFDVLCQAKAAGGLAREEVAILEMLAIHKPAAERKATGEKELTRTLRRSIGQARTMRLRRRAG